MNKFLMMSAAAVMGTMAVGQANAGTFQGTAVFENSTGTVAYCDYMDVYKGGTGQYAGIHNLTSGCGYTHNYAANGFPVKGSFGVKGAVSLGDGEGGSEAVDYLVSSFPLKKKSTWNVWISTNGTTSFLVNGGHEAHVAGSVHQTKQTSVGKLASILK